MATRIQLRNDITANWETANPILATGEIGVDRSKNMFKVGDGTTAWSALPYKGLDGRTLLNGTSDPSASDGEEGDFYINTSTNDIFGPKIGDVWPSGVSLIGPQGIQGPAGGRTLFNGNTPPESSLGEIDDFYLDYFTWTIYGPKTVSGWGSGTGIIGPQGPQGDKGIQGVQGVQGNQGPQGDQGPRGRSVLNGISDPDTNIGEEGDWYINTSTDIIFGPKSLGVWPAGVSLVGPAGEDGRTILNGTIDPDNSIGLNGDFYLQTTDGVLYGPKTDGIWSTGVSLVGAHNLDFHSDVGGFSISDPLVNGMPAQGISDRLSREDHVHPVDTSREASFAKNTAFNKDFGSTAGTVCEGDDSRLSDSRTPIAHPHDATDVTSGIFSSDRIPVLDASKVGTGVFDIGRIPAAALERLVPVADQSARFALTTATVQNGDTVKQMDTGLLYVVVDELNLNSELGYEEYTAASASSVPWTGVTSKPATFPPDVHSISTHSDVDGFSIADPLMAGTAAQGISSRLSREDHIHPTDTSREASFTKNTAFNKDFGNAVGTVCEGSDVRLSDTRDPNNHDLISSHTASGLTSGYFLKATGAGAFAFAAHGLTAIDVSAAPDTHVGDTGAAHGVATVSVNGFMSTADKTKLNGIADGATANVAATNVPSAPTTTGSSGVGTAYARDDHAHPSRIATSAPTTPQDGDIWIV